jgi:uncharacterized protein YndB with AHSA1/START domain
MTMTAPTMTSTDRIEEQVLLPTSRARVWRALTDPQELGAWFGMNLAGATIAPGADIRGRFTIPGHEHATFEATIEEMVPEQRFAWRWHPGATEPGIDYTAEQRTLVTFLLEDAPQGGTLLRVVESGFDAVPSSRRAAALLGNTKGWQSQLHKRIVAYLASA